MRILIVEDESALREGLVELLTREGHEARSCADGAEAFERCCREPFDLVILDVGLPGLDGIECCSRLRARSKDVPVILLTALGDEADKVRGLDAGADDFVTKPFGSRELLARISAVARRSRPSGSPERIQIDECLLDLGSCQATRASASVSLSAREAAILRWLKRHEGRGVSRADLLQHVWGVPRHLRTRAVDMAISTLRQKIERDPSRPQIIVSGKGVGYAWGGA